MKTTPKQHGLGEAVSQGPGRIAGREAITVQRTGAVILAGVMLLAIGAFAQPARRQEIDLQAAIRTETVHGDLKGAIKQYEAIVSRYGKSDHSVAARALVRMGQCYEKLGDAEARKAYERVVREFGDQADAVAEARKRLGAKGGTEDSEMVARLMQDDQGGWYGPAISRDGRYIAESKGFGATETQLRLRDLVTGESKVLVTAPPETEVYRDPIVSPGGKYVAYGKSPQPQGPQEVYVVGAGGGSPRLLLKGGRAFAWSPDAKLLLAVAWRGKGPERVLLPAGGGTPVVIGAGEMREGRFSPDGSQIVFARARKPGDNRSDIFLQSIKGGAEVPLVENHGSATAPVYWPDGKRLLFLSDHAGSQDLWSIPLVNGAPGGPPALVKQQVRTLLGVTDAGDCFYQTSFMRSTLLVTGFDTRTGKVTSRPKAISDRDFNLWAAWSPDGEYLAYTAQVGASPLIELEVVIRSMKTGEERRVTRKEFPGFEAAEQAPQWFPDSRSLLLRTWDGKLAKVDARKPELQPLLGGRSVGSYRGGGPWGKTVLAPDGRTIYYAVMDPRSGESRIVRRDLEGEAEKEICRFAPVITGALSISSDGSALLFPVLHPAAPTQKNRTFAIMTVATGGGTPKELYRTSSSGIYDAMWSADGGWVLFTRRFGDVYSMPASGGEPEALGIGPMHDLFLSCTRPDGKEFVMTDWDGGRQLWVLKNLFGRVPAK